MTGTEEKIFECLEVLGRELYRVSDDRDVFVIATGLSAPIVGSRNNGFAVDDAELVVHGRLVAAALREKSHTPPAAPALES